MHINCNYSIAYELKKSDDQRNKNAIETTYIPELIIEEKPFYLYSLDPKTSSLKMEFSYEDKNVDNQTNSDRKSYNNSFGLPVYNIGLGTAKNISVDFSFDISNTIDVINQFGKDVPNSIEVKAQSKNGIVQLLEFTSTNYKSMNVVSNQTERKINHILPVNVSSNNSVLYLPFYILDLYSSFIYNYFHTTNYNADFQFPPISILLEYHDIGNKSFSKKFEVKLETSAMQSNVQKGSTKIKSVNAFEIKELVS